LVVDVLVAHADGQGASVEQERLDLGRCADTHYGGYAGIECVDATNWLGRCVWQTQACNVSSQSGRSP
jgi:hypothetical protein